MNIELTGKSSHGSAIRRLCLWSEGAGFGPAGNELLEVAVTTTQHAHHISVDPYELLEAVSALVIDIERRRRAEEEADA